MDSFFTLPTVQSSLTESKMQACQKVLSTPELIVEIFKFIPSSEDHCSKLTCHLWTSLTPSITAARMFATFPFLKEPAKAPSQSFDLTPYLDDWEGVPKFSCVTKDVITYRPTYPDFFDDMTPFNYVILITSSMPFIKDNCLLGHCGDTYLLQSCIDPDRSLSVIKKNTEEKWETCPLHNILGDLNLTDIWFPVSNNKIVLFSFAEDEMMQATCLNLIDKKISYIFTFPRNELSYKPTKLGNHLILNTVTIDLDTDLPKMVKHGFDFKNMITTVFESSLYVSGITDVDWIESYSINTEGKLEKNWELTGSNSDDSIVIHMFLTEVKCVNNKFIVLLCNSEFKLLNTQGLQLCFPIRDKEGSHVDVDQSVVHLVDDILIYQHPDEEFLTFWHIPTKKCINKLKWNSPRIIDIHSTTEKLTFLTMNEQAECQVVQFDLNMLI